MRTWQRPSTDMLFASIVLVMPIAAYMARKNDVGDWHTDIAVVIVFAALAAILSALAMRTRDRILLAAAAVSTAIAAVEAHDWFSLAIEWKLILSGAAIVGAAAILSRILTKRTAGFVVTPHALTRYDELIQIAGTLAIATPAQSVAGPSHEGGGKFGGAGATAEY
jgi:hypothetical protein